MGKLLAAVVVVGALASSCGEPSEPAATQAQSSEPASRETRAPTTIPSTPATTSPSTRPPVDWPEPFDCSTVIGGAEMLADATVDIVEIEQQLPLMIELHADTVLIWEEFGIQPDHLMIDGLPHMIVNTDDVAGRCDEIVAAVEHPGLLLVADYTEAVYLGLYDAGSPPWRRLIQTEAGDAGDRWVSMGTGLFGVTSLNLREGEERLASELSDRYGPLVDIMIADFEFDTERGVAVGPAKCSELPRDTSRDELVIESANRTESEGIGLVSFEIRNDGPSAVHLVPGRTARLTRVDGSTTLTRLYGDETAEARGSIEVAPGLSASVNGQLTLAACDPSGGTALPAGTYEATLVVSVHDQQAFEGDPSDEILVARLEIELP